LVIGVSATSAENNAVASPVVFITGVTALSGTNNPTASGGGGGGGGTATPSGVSAVSGLGIVTAVGTTGNPSYRNGTPVVLPIDFGNQMLLPHEFGNAMLLPFEFGNVVTWSPTPDHFGNIITDG
jgi:hypothetical protein